MSSHGDAGCSVPDRATGPGLSRATAVLVATAFALLYGLLRQPALHGGDVHFILGDLGNGKVVNDRHFLFLPTALPWCRVAGWFGVSLHTALQWLSACGTAGGLYFVLLANRALGFDRRTNLAMAAALGLCPSVLHFATVVEYHGLAFLGYGLAWRTWVHWCRRPGLALAVAHGAATAFTAGMHTFGHLLPLFSALWFAIGTTHRARWLLAGGALLSHALLTLPTLLLTDPLRPVAGITQAFVHTSGWTRLPLAPAVALREWLLPYVPISLGLLVALRPRWLGTGATAAPPFRAGWLLLVAWVTWLLPTCWLVALGDERGAYMAALACPSAWLLVQALPRRWHGPLVAISAAAGLFVWSHPDREPWSEQFGSGVLRIADAQTSFIVVGTWAERDAVAVLRPTLPVEMSAIWMLNARAVSDPRREVLGAGVDVLVDTLAASGARLVLTNSAMQDLATSDVPLLRWVATEYLPTHFQCKPLDVDGFHGIEVARKTAGR